MTDTQHSIENATVSIPKQIVVMLTVAFYIICWVS